MISITSVALLKIAGDHRDMLGIILFIGDRTLLQFLKTQVYHREGYPYNFFFTILAIQLAYPVVGRIPKDRTNSSIVALSASVKPG